MNSLKKNKIKTRAGADADVEIFQRDDGSLLAVALVNGESYAHSVSIGAVGQPLPDGYKQAAFDGDIATASAYAAEMAESAARKKILIAGMS